MDALYQLDHSKFKVGPLCKRNHDWQGLGVSLRYRKSGHCFDCERLRAVERYASMTDEEREHNRFRQLQDYHDKKNDPEWLAKRNRNARDNTRRSNAKQRATKGRASRAKGLGGVVVPVGLKLPTRTNSGVRRLVVEMAQEGRTADEIRVATQEWQACYETFRRLQANPAPTVAELVMAEQRRHWRECPEDRQEHVRQWAKERDRFRRMTDESYRLYHRQKSKRKKAMMRNSAAVQISGKQIKRRFSQFGDVCAYCGCTDDLQIEHVMPISKGGAHVIENIVPACRECNAAKRDHDVEQWFRAQPFFSEVRWRAIRKATGWLGGGAQQRKLA